MDADNNARSRSIAGLAGPLMMAMAAGLLMNRKLMPEIAAQVGNDYGLIFMSGAILLVAGVAIVRDHNIWSGGWPVLVTLIGWLAVVGGVARMLYFRHLAAMATTVAQHPAALLGMALVMLFTGAYLTLKGYCLLDE